MSGLVRQVLDGTKGLSDLVDRTSALWPKVSAALRATCEDVDRRLACRKIAVLVAGPPGPEKRLLFNAAVGADVFDPAAPEQVGVCVFVRNDANPTYIAALRDGNTIDFARTRPERTAMFDKDVAQAERDVSAASERLAESERRLEQAHAIVAPARAPVDTVPALHASPARRARFAWVRFLRWISALLWSLVRRSPPSASAPKARAALPSAETRDAMKEKQAAEADLVRTRERLAHVRAARATHLAERYESFLGEIRDLTDAGRRGNEVVEIEIVVPGDRLPADVVLVDAPTLMLGDEADRAAAWVRVREDLGGCIFISRSGTRANTSVLAEHLRAIVPHAIDAPGGRGERFEDRLHSELPATLARIRTEAPTVAVALAVIDVRLRLHSLAEASAKAEGGCRERLAVLERERVPPPERFRTEQMARLDPVIDESAHRTLKRACETLHAMLAELESEWSAAIDGCDGRAAVESFIAEINATASAHLESLIDRLTDEVARDVQTSAETLHAWVLQDLRATYGVAGAPDDPSALVVSDAPAEEVASIREIPLAKTVETFESKRVGIGLGGVAAGAALGTLLLPGIGTAVGAFVGVFAGFLEGTPALRRATMARLRAHFEDVERETSARLEGAKESFADDIRRSVGDATSAALARREASIRDLIERQESAVARERKKLGDVARIRSALDVHEARFAELANVAADELRRLAERRQ